MSSSSGDPDPPRSGRGGAPGASERPATDEPAAAGGPARQLDLRGEVCPFTFVRARLALEEMPTGAALHILVDHEPATRNIPRSAEAWGQRVGSICAAGAGQWSITIVKTVD